MTRLEMGDSQLLVEVLRQHERSGGRVRSGVELGVHRGETSAALLRAFPDLWLLMIDPWATYQPNDRYRKSGDGCSRLTQAEQDDNMRAAEAAVKFAGGGGCIWRRSSQDAAAVWASTKWVEGVDNFDFIFVDAAHDLESVREDIRLWWPFVRRGGLLVGHDYNHKRNRTGRFGVNRAVDEFVSRESLKLTVYGTVWCVPK